MCSVLEQNHIDLRRRDTAQSNTELVWLYSQIKHCILNR